MIQLSSFFTRDSTLSPFSKYKVDFEPPFNSRDTTLSSFSNCNNLESNVYVKIRL